MKDLCRVAEMPPRLREHLYPNLCCPPVDVDAVDAARLAYCVGDKPDEVRQQIDPSFDPTPIDEAIDAQLQPIREFVAVDAHRMHGDTSGVVTASLLLAAAAHEGERRANGRAFITHPMAVAALTAVVLQNDPSVDRQRVNWQRATAAALLHDTFESALDDETAGALADRLGPGSRTVVPRVVERLFASCDRLDGIEAAASVTDMTKVRGVRGDKIDDRAYVYKIGRDIGTQAVKVLDRIHNQLDSKPEAADLRGRQKQAATIAEYRRENAAVAQQAPTLASRPLEDAARVLDSAWPVYVDYVARDDVKGWLVEHQLHDLEQLDEQPPYDAKYAHSEVRRDDELVS